VRRGNLVGELKKAGARIRRGNLEIIGNLLWDSVRPKTIVVDVRKEMVDLRRKTRVGGVRRGRVIFTLEGIPEENDSGKRRVRSDGEVEVPARHLVDLVDYKEGGSFSEGGLPSGHTPVLLRSKMKELLPLGPELGGGDCNTKQLSKIFPGEHADEREGFSAPGKTGEMDETDSTGGGGVDKPVKLLDGFSTFSRLGGEQRGKDAVGPVLHVRDKILGTGDLHAVVMEMVEGKMRISKAEVEDRGLERARGGADEGKRGRGSRRAGGERKVRGI
jgi:hypothetical protein